MDFWDDNCPLLLLDSFWEKIKRSNCGWTFVLGGPIGLLGGLAKVGVKIKILQTIIWAQRVIWNIVIALCVPSEATQRQGRCSSAQRNLRFKTCSSRVCFIVSDDWVATMAFFFEVTIECLTACQHIIR
jgi:hypothetical protein